MMPDKLKMTVTISFFLLFTFQLLAPGNTMLVVVDSQPVEPYRQLIQAIGMVETGKDTMAYNPIENATGYFQIRLIRLEDFNVRTGSNYTQSDLFNYEISEKIFLYYASLIGPYDFEQIARNWNGSGPLTTYYWEQVKKLL
ncbi:MAG TPA: hypothetical protein PLR88_02105 [Bacteroidales bacterium]|nr:hypothetical protein [Bacteroidales bacterium]HPT20712.1 hypothetical protein [Bacteroidales bacterium]